MTDQPLQPFSPPTAVLDSLRLSGVITAAQIVWGILYAVCFYWLVYTLVAAYHWFKYSHASWLTVPAIILHLGVSYVLIVYALTGAIHLPL